MNNNMNMNANATASANVNTDNITEVIVNEEVINMMKNMNVAPETVETVEIQTPEIETLEPVVIPPVRTHMGYHRFAQYDTETQRTRDHFLANMGPDLSQIHTLESALELSGLNFNVVKTPVQYMTKTPGKPPRYNKFADKFVTLRDDTFQPLGIVGKRFDILQNIEAFNFLDNLALEGAKFETGGSYGPNGGKSFISMSTEPMSFLGDTFMPYLLFLNGFDGTQCVQVMFTTVRTFCSNAINRAIKNSQNRIMIRHSGLMRNQLEQAHEVLLANTNYLEHLKKTLEIMADKTFTENQFYDLIQELFPVNVEDSEIIQARSKEKQNLLMVCYKETDLDNFSNTAYRAIQAVSDYETHKPQERKSKNADFVSFNTVVGQGMPLFNQVFDMMEQMV